MKRIVQPNVRKVYGVNSSTTTQQQQQSPEMNSAVRKIHNLLSSGAVTVTGPNQPRILKQKPLAGSGTVVTTTTTTTTHHNSQQQTQSAGHCYICDETTPGTGNQCLTDMTTSHTSTKFPNKIGQVVGDAFMVIVSVEDIVCPRCTNLINYLDRLENDVDRVKKNLLSLLYKKYGLNDETTPASISGGGASTLITSNVPASSPPVKMQKLNSGNVVNRRIGGSDDSHDTGGTTRKVVVQTRDPIENQLSNIFDGESSKPSPVSAVQQIKITTPQMAQQQQQQQQKSKQTPVKIYKCMSCDFKTTNLKEFQPHYDKCKPQNFQCKVCNKLFTTIGALRQHMSEKHANTTEYSCSICQINFINETAMKKHLELNHSDGSKQVGIVSEPQPTQLYTCNLCQYKTTEKPLFDDHMRKHGKLKPFKCRLCAMRFESREQASIHAKTHQPNYFKCGTCTASFQSRDLLIKHFETHNQPQPQQQQQQQQQQKQIVQQPTMLTTQKLLQDTIDEALRESEGVESKGIHFFSCNICSLTFIQENYYNQHMETHKRDGKKVSTTSTTNSVTNATITAGNSSRIAQHTATAAKDITTATSQSASASISESDIESIFEKMHSDKNDDNLTTNSVNTSTINTVTDSTTENKNLVITTQENTVGGITFNITIPQENTDPHATTEAHGKSDSHSDGQSVKMSIDMPVLDQADETSNLQETNSTQQHQSQKDSTDEDAEQKDDSNKVPSGPVSMPSLDDDTEMQTSSQEEEEHQHQSEEQTSTEQELQQQEQDEHNQQQEHDDQQQQVTMGDDQVQMELEDIQNSVDSGQIKFILNENGQLLQLDNHILTTDADGNQILVQGTDSEHIQQLLQSVGVLQTGDGLDGETLQMIGDNNQMVIVQQGDNEAQLIDASLLNADGHLVIQQGQDGELGEGAHVIGEDGTRIPVSVSYTADGQQIIQATGQHEDVEHKDMDGNIIATTTEQSGVTQTLTQSDGGQAFFELDDLMQQPEKAAE